jgi:hypothetical protein
MNQDNLAFSPLSHRKFNCPSMKGQPLDQEELLWLHRNP